MYFGYITELSPDWLPIAKMTWRKKEKYYYSFTNAYAKNIDITPGLKGMSFNSKCGLSKTWILDSPPSLIDSSIPRRPDSMEVYDWLDLSDRKGDFVAYFARIGGKIRNFIDVFPQVEPNRLGYYDFYFPILDIASRVNEEKAVINAISAEDTLKVVRGNKFVGIYKGNTCIGSCPNYVYYLLNLDSFESCEIKINLVNSDEASLYAFKFLVRLSVKFSSNPYDCFDLQPLNTMPISEQ